MLKTIGSALAPIGAAGIAAGFIVGGERGMQMREAFTLPALVGIIVVMTTR